jgi:hypothetical protein
MLKDWSEVMYKRVLWVFIVIILVVSLGCSSKNSGNIGHTSSIGNTKKIVNVQNTKPVQNKNLTAMLIKEKHVIGGQAYVQNNMAIMVAVMDKNATKAYAKKIANKYIKLLKVKYKNMEINAQVVSNGKSLVNIMNK